MRTFECDPKMEISGNLVVSLLVNLQAEHFQPFLEKYGFTDVDPNQWYPFQNMLNVFREVSEEPGAMFDFVAVGMAAVERYKLPPEIANKTLEDFFMNVMPSLINRSYRNGEPTRVKVEKLADKHLLIGVVSSHPDDASYGFMYGFARHYVGPHERFTLKYDDDQPRHDDGGDETLMHLTWN